MTDPSAAAKDEIRQLTSDLFHGLSQPLTNLCCSFELALLQSPTTEEYRQIVRDALLQAEKASGLAAALRELLDAGHPGEEPELLDLSHEVDEAVGDLLPVAESAGVRIAYLPGFCCLVWFNPLRLRQGLFHLLGSLIGLGGPGSIGQASMGQASTGQASTGQASTGQSSIGQVSTWQGSVLKIELEMRGPKAQLGMTVSGVADRIEISEAQPDRELLQRLELAISRAIFEAAGGTFSVERGAQCQTVKVGVLGKAG